MAEIVVSQKKQLGHSSLRHEVNPESTDDERAESHEQIQVPDSQVVVSETQLSAKYGLDSETPDSPNTRDIIERNRISNYEARMPVEAIPFNVTYLSKQAFVANDKAVSPVFAFQPLKAKAANSSASGCGSGANTQPEQRSATTEACQDPSGQAVPTSCQSRSSKLQLSCTPTELEQSKDQSQHSVLDRENRTEHELDAAHPRPTIEDGSVSAPETAEAVDGIPQENTEFIFASRSAQPTQGSMPAQKKARSGGKKGKKLGRRQPQEPHPLVRPLPLGDSRTKFEVDRYESTAVDRQKQDTMKTDTATSPAFANNRREVSPVPQHHAAIGPGRSFGAPTDTHDSSVEVDKSSQAHTEIPLQCPQPNEQSLNVVHVAKPRVHTTLPPSIQSYEAPLHATSDHSGVNRVAKGTKKPRAMRGSQPARLKAGSAMASAVDGALQSLRVALLADQFRNEHVNTARASEIESLRQTISALQQANNAHEGHIKSMEATEAGLRAKMSQQAERVKVMGKFLTGLGTDCDIFKANIEAQQAACSSGLEKAIAEATKEKVALEEDFLTTVETLQKSQRTMRQTLDDCFVRLQISEARKKDLEEALKAKSLICKEESDKRAQLEQQIMASIQHLQRHVEENQGNLVVKLGDMQAGVEKMAHDDSRDALIQECMTALKDFHNTPFLTIKDVKKAEEMLQFLRTSLETKLGDLSSCFANNEPSSEEFHGHVRNELGALKKDLIKYDEVHANYLSVRQSNAQLTQQLSTERSKCDKLDEEIKELRQSETDLKTRYTDLEAQLATTKEAVSSDDSEPKKLLREMDALRGRLIKTEQDLQEAQSKVNEAARLQHDAEKDAAECRKSSEESMTKLTEIVKDDKKRAKHASDYRKQAREQAIQEGLRIVGEKEAAFNNNLHRVTRERDDKENRLQLAIQELDATRTALQRGQQQVRELESNAKELRRQKAEAESKLRKAEREAEDHTIVSEELESVREQLQSKTAALQTMEAELNTVRQDLAASQQRNSELQESHDQMKLDLTEERSVIEQKNNDQIAVQNFQAQVRSLQQTNNDLRANLDALRSQEGADLEDAHAKFSVEKRQLEEQVKGVQAAKQSCEQELQRVQNEAAEQSKKYNTRYDADVESLKARLEQSSTATKELKGKIQSIEEYKERELAAHKKVTEKKMEEKLAAQIQAYKEHQSEEVATTGFRPNSESDGIRTSSQGQSSQGLSQNMGTLSLMSNHAKPKKKVDRQSHSVFSIHSSLGNALAESTPFPTAPSAETAYDLRQDEEVVENEELHPDELGAQEDLDETGVSLREPPPGTVPDTQDVGLSFEQLNQRLMRSASADRVSSSQLSEVDEELLSSLKPYDMAIPKGHARVAGRTPLKEAAGDPVVYPHQYQESPSREAAPSDRPVSRANTASRIMMPPGYLHPSDEAAWKGQTTPKTRHESRSRVKQHASYEGEDKTSSPDYVQKPSSGAPVTYGQQSGKSGTPRAGPRNTWPFPSGDDSNQHKRKSSVGHADRTPSGKRSKGSPQYVAAETPRRSQSKFNMPSSSGGSFRSQSQMRSSYGGGKNDSAGSAARSGRSKKDRYDWRFAAELK
ncbi:hypothetical protein K491DRAFT_160100 [Lophiostoma macrostomum CBS 122681]|uniref:Uncharacterized protein n=1 Tax=Lophiostoma macrostomum CBS 122681 TaxID=1314788 RepID=A0A6A6STI1_9PLEO|nr:hypothetical protein K491DRAFT_160100 [Lophiostoma macrostomum CBS 122681]